MGKEAFVGTKVLHRAARSPSRTILLGRGLLYLAVYWTSVRIYSDLVLREFGDLADLRARLPQDQFGGHHMAVALAGLAAADSSQQEFRRDSADLVQVA